MEINTPEAKEGNSETKNSKKRSIDKVISPTKIAKTDVGASDVNNVDDLGKSKVELGENESSDKVEGEPSECFSNELYGEDDAMVEQGQGEKDNIGLESNVEVDNNLREETPCTVESQMCRAKKKEKKKSAKNKFAEETKKTIQKERKKVEKGNRKKKKHMGKDKNDELREVVVKLAEVDDDNDDGNQGDDNDDSSDEDVSDDDSDDNEEEEESKGELLDDVSDDVSDDESDEVSNEVSNEVSDHVSGEVSNEEVNGPEEGDTDEEGKNKEEESPKVANIEGAKEGDQEDNPDDADASGEASHDDHKDSDKNENNQEDDNLEDDNVEDDNVEDDNMEDDNMEDDDEEADEEEEVGTNEKEDEASKEKFDEEDATPRKGSDDEEKGSADGENATDEEDLGENETNKSSLNKNQKSDNESAASESSDIKKNDRLFASMNDNNSPNKLFSEHVGKLSIFGNVNIDIEKLRQRLNKNKSVMEEKKEVKISETEDPFENEEVVYSESSIKISKFIKKNEKYDWSGYLPVKIQIMKNVENKKYRILCFQKGSGRLFLNTDIFEGFKIIPSKSTSALFSGRDICDEKKLNQYIVTFMSSTSRDEFVKHIKNITDG
ncbi:conserved Plasmodium protein, unknown function [Plasmodium knowlesi strain H]|uniref:RanBD1 domain-containing protein n=3 Tax=Plasmodium knowlesi TaxID=5850 RepID=A0A5E7WTQ7_PLAKH|nr:conserved Plasmodium protein, unknown function [Plasmodium knowlesi strain H]OTN68550.1 Uncharacterized protein PKNOH_S02294600 [Plasmodium knowlesi]CAA9986451.1 conserved Plasmodium protein, unknown function [Plasmodium knowlesi strain H]SBO24300.1 conserved Plasmodium protein, unknown function [Plasmodium knowlesi strain H]SBO29699.1 conserved Plasmodium protein, unknown function [Plasmodium knowlesi strain H]VVS75925.1 conserved Plasmodium protein, unknown function [Plasmodium knowlesi s